MILIAGSRSVKDKLQGKNEGLGLEKQPGMSENDKMGYNEELAEFQTIFRLLAEGVSLNELVRGPTGSVVDYRILAVNNAFYEVADFDSSYRVIGGLASELFAMSRATIAEFAENHAPVTTAQTTQYFSHRSLRWFRITTSPFVDDRFVTTFQDITEQTRSREQQERVNRLEAVGIMAGGLAHDFNNLLAGMSGHLEIALLELANDPSLVKERLELAAGVIERGRALTQQLLTFSKDQGMHPQVTSLGPALRQVTSFSVAGNRTSVVFEVPGDLWQCEVDLHQFGQVFENLTLNAVQAMAGGGRLVVRASNRIWSPGDPSGLLPGPFVVVSYQDQGPGIAPELLPQLFQPFFTTKPSGTGLGLASVHSILLRHHGTVTVDSTPGSGCTFHLWIPSLGNR